MLMATKTGLTIPGARFTYALSSFYFDARW
jgi:hypothetical protein